MKNIQKERPIQVVKYTKEARKFEITQEARDFFQQLDGDIGFVVVCGKYRTGKSFMLNKLLDVSGDGVSHDLDQFRVDSATDSCTQGIWMFTKPIINPKTNVQIYFLDTEGSESIERGQNHDAKIFALAILMSSIFVFNSRGCIDETSISQLQLTTTLAKNIQVQDSGKDSVNESQLKYFTPKFVWVLRDYVLEMRDSHQKELTPKEYMENALNDESAYVKANDANKKIRKSLLSFFKERSCFTLITPTDDKQLDIVNNLPFTSLRPEFQATLNKIKEYILNNCSPKQLHSENVNGRMFCSMLDNYISVINRGGVPNLETAWDSIVRNECAQGFEIARKNYQTTYDSFFVKNQNRRKLEETLQILAKMRDECYDQFHFTAGVREMNKHYEEYKKKLQDLMNELEDRVIMLNEEKNAGNNQELIAQLIDKVQKDVAQQNFSFDDLNAFATDFSNFIVSYDKQASGCNKSETLFEYLKHTHQNLLKKLELSVKQKSGTSKNKKINQSITNSNNNNQEISVAIRDYESQSKLLEQNISQQEIQLKKLDDEKQKLDIEKKKLKEQLDQLQNNANKEPVLNQEAKGLQEDIKKQQEEIANIKKAKEALQKQKKKGCCG